MDAHPKAVEAQARKLILANQRECIKEAKRVHSVRFLRVGAYTICYRPDQTYNGRRRQVLELSTALRHPKDPDNKHTGQWAALKRFQQNSRILVHYPEKMPVKTFLMNMFSDQPQIEINVFPMGLLK